MNEETLRNIMSQALLPIHENLNKLNDNMQSLEQRVRSLEEEQQFIKQAVLETNEKVTRIDKNQDNHERILDLLSRRSIEHELEIKHLK